MVVEQRERQGFGLSWRCCGNLRVKCEIRMRLYDAGLHG